jgi:hypothetical protein
MANPKRNIFTPYLGDFCAIFGWIALCIVTSRLPPKLKMAPVISRIAPTMTPKRVAIPVIATPANPAPTAVSASLPVSADCITSDAALPGSKNVEIGRAKTAAPATKKPLPNARRIVGAKKQKTQQSVISRSITMGVALSSSAVKAANAGASAMVDTRPNTNPIKILNNALNILTYGPSQVCQN